jgi:hypothetical protein
MSNGSDTDRRCPLFRHPIKTDAIYRFQFDSRSATQALGHYPPVWPKT